MILALVVAAGRALRCWPLGSLTLSSSMLMVLSTPMFLLLCRQWMSCVWQRMFVHRVLLLRLSMLRRACVLLLAASSAMMAYTLPLRACSVNGAFG
jgi:hypothetical protein